MNKQDFLNTIESINDKALEYATNELPEGSTESDVLDLQTEFFFDDFQDWFVDLGAENNWVVELLVNDEECRSRLIDFTQGYDLVDLMFSEYLDENEASLFPDYSVRL